MSGVAYVGTDMYLLARAPASSLGVSSLSRRCINLFYFFLFIVPFIFFPFEIYSIYEDLRFRLPSSVHQDSTAANIFTSPLKYLYWTCLVSFWIC